MQNEDDWPEQPKEKKSGLSGFLIPLATLALGGLGGFFLASQPPAPIISAQPGVATFGAPATAPAGAEVAAAQQEVALYRQINDQFVGQLRKYEIRLREIADVAEAEGAASASVAMRDFALETELIIDRYDKIAKTQQ